MVAPGEVIGLRHYEADAVLRGGHHHRVHHPEAGDIEIHRLPVSTPPPEFRQVRVKIICHPFFYSYTTLLSSDRIFKCKLMKLPDFFFIFFWT
jgi:hypothetical protein